MDLHTGIYLRTKEIRAFTLLEYFTCSLASTPSIMFTRSQLPFLGGSCLLVREHGAESCFGSLLCSCSQLPFSGVAGQDEDGVGGGIFAAHTSISQPLSNPTPTAAVAFVFLTTLSSPNHGLRSPGSSPTSSVFPVAKILTFFSGPPSSFQVLLLFQERFFFAPPLLSGPTSLWFSQSK